MIQGKVVFRKGVKIIGVCIAVLVALFLLTLFAFSMMHTGADKINHVTQFFKTSVIVILFRLAIYLAVYFGWAKIVMFLSSSKRKVNPPLSDDEFSQLVISSRKVMVLIMIVYEVLCWFQFFNY